MFFGARCKDSRLSTWRLSDFGRLPYLVFRRALVRRRAVKNNFSYAALGQHGRQEAPVDRGIKNKGPTPVRTLRASERCRAPLFSVR